MIGYYFKNSLSLIILFSLFLNCAPYYRTESGIRRYKRYVIIRERRLLKRRMRRWSIRIDNAYRSDLDLSDAQDVTRRLKVRVRKAREVIRMFNRKLRNHDELIPFKRYQWRKAYNVGCRRYR